MKSSNLVSLVRNWPPFEDLRPIQPEATSLIFNKDANGELAPFGLFEYKRACTSFDLDLVNYMKAQQELLDYILSSLSSSSKSLLKTKIGANGYAEAKASYGTRRVWELIIETHAYKTSGSCTIHAIQEAT